MCIATSGDMVVHGDVSFGLVPLRPHCSLQLSSARLIVVLVPGSCWASSAFSVQHRELAA